jgi:hypothetical protein
MDTDAVLNHRTVPFLKKQLYGDSFLSCYYEDKIAEVDKVFLETLDTDNLYGILASRPVIINFAKFPEKNTMIHEFLYVCVHDKYKNKNISRNLIQTHIYQHQSSKDIAGGYVFQKHLDLCKAVVPLVEYITYTFVLRDTPIPKLPTNYSIRSLNTTHVNLWRGIYAKILSKYEVSLLPEFHFTLDWLKNERYSIFTTVYKKENIEHIHGVYVFENTCISWENERLEKPHVVRLAASVDFGENADDEITLYFRGFLNCIKTYLVDKKEFGILEIPCISDNHIILERWQNKYELRNSSPSAYYLYNLIYPSSPLPPSQFFIL